MCYSAQNNYKRQYLEHWLVEGKQINEITGDGRINDDVRLNIKDIVNVQSSTYMFQN